MCCVNISVGRRLCDDNKIQLTELRLAAGAVMRTRLAPTSQSRLPIARIDVFFSRHCHTVATVSVLVAWKISDVVLNGPFLIIIIILKIIRVLETIRESRHSPRPKLH